MSAEPVKVRQADRMRMTDKGIEMLGGHHRVHGVDNHFLRTLDAGMTGNAHCHGDGKMVLITPFQANGSGLSRRKRSGVRQNLS